MSRKLYVIVLLLVVITVLGNGLLTAVAQSEAVPGSAPGQTGDLISANNAFAFDLYTALNDSQHNLIFSPYSISLALTLVYSGARGQTETEMAQVLHFDEPALNVNESFKDLQEMLTMEVEPPEWGGAPSIINIVNGLWAEESYPLRPEYIDLLDEYYAVTFEPVDFLNAPDEAREMINNWISDNTNQRIKQMLGPGSITPDIRTILANVIFFKGTWLMRFPDENTVNEPFTLLDGTEVTVPMMHLESQYAYLDREGYQAVSLSFQDTVSTDIRPVDMAMLFILPDEGTFTDVQNMLTAEWFSTTVEEMTYYPVKLGLPRFSSETQVDLAPILIKMGMAGAFDVSKADFSGIVEDNDVPFFISFVLHKANIDVDETGTEAAAATVMGLGGGGPPQEPIELTFNRPFIYAIYDRISGTILFLGHVTNPSE